MYRCVRSRPSQYPRSLKARRSLLPLTSFIRPSSWWQPGVHGLLYLTVFRGSQRATSFFREFLSGTSTFLEEISVYVACNHCFIRCKTLFSLFLEVPNGLLPFSVSSYWEPLLFLLTPAYIICFQSVERRIKGGSGVFFPLFGSIFRTIYIHYISKYISFKRKKRK